MKTEEKFSLKEIENKEFILHHHLGLGDSIVCNGMVNYLSKDFEKIYLPVKDNNYKTIKFLYSENNRVEIFKVENETRENDVSNFANNNNLEILRVGFKNVGDTPFNKAFYKQLNLPYKYSIKYFSIPRSDSMQDNLMKHLVEYYKIKDNKFNVIHNESSGKKYELKNINGTNNIFVSKESDIYGNMLLYKKLIENAEEIHCINSSFIHLVERVNNIGKIYYHHIRKSKLFLKKRWKVINYED